MRTPVGPILGASFLRRLTGTSELSAVSLLEASELGASVATCLFPTAADLAAGALTSGARETSACFEGVGFEGLWSLPRRLHHRLRPLRRLALGPVQVVL